MKGHIVQIDEDHSPAHAGITAVVSQLSGYLCSQGVSNTILTAGEGSMPIAAGVESRQISFEPLRPALAISDGHEDIFGGGCQDPGNHLSLAWSLVRPAVARRPYGETAPVAGPVNSTRGPGTLALAA